MFLSLLIAHLGACSSPPPGRNEAAQYINSIQPLMLENHMLAERRLQLAAKIYNGDLTNENLVESWETEILPLSSHLYQQASLIEAPEDWKTTHENLVRNWKERSLACIEISEALVLADGERWERAFKLYGTTIPAEETWFSSVNETLAPLNLKLEQFP